MSILNQDYSSVAINYDYTYTNFLTLTDNKSIAQLFVLPINYTRGTNSNEQRIPDISGFQILVDVADMNTASFDWSIGYTESSFPINISQFTFLQSGNTTGTYKNNLVWFDIIFNKSVQVTSDLLNYIWIVQLTPQNITTAAYFDYSGGGYDTRIQAYNIDQNIYNKPSLVAIDYSPASFNFRLLSLAADNGTDFLGNSYRSVVSTLPVFNVNETKDMSIGGIGGYWLSPALPASDAVASLYFDMRPVSNVPMYDLINIIPNPSFEYDSGTSILDWTSNVPSGTLETFAIATGEAPYGVNMLHMVVENVPTNNYVQISSTYLPVNFGTPYAGSVVIDLTASESINCYGLLQFDWYNYNGTSYTYINSSLSDQIVYTDSNYNISTTIATAPVIPATATHMKATITVYNASGSNATLDFKIDGIVVINNNNLEVDDGLFPEFFPSLITYPSGIILISYFDGDSPNCQWTGQPGNSSSIEVISNQLLNQSTVVDAMVLESIFANQNYTLYYSNDDNIASPSTVNDWENKLWARASSGTTNFANQTQVLAQPISAKYIKLELTNPQMQSYDPGAFQLPITYKTFPSWVQNYFLSQVQYPSYNTDQVVVQSDALSSLYVTNIENLNQSPDVPSIPSSSTYVATSANSQLDNETLSQIDLTVSPYQNTLGTQADPTTTLGAIAINQTNNTINGAQQVSEAQAPTYPAVTTVSSLQRDSILAELLTPDMYFFYTCRHAYMIKTATLADNKAYFFGINNITFLRSQGSVATDSNVYTETGYDMINSKLNDFTLTDQGWWDTYAN